VTLLIDEKRDVRIRVARSSVVGVEKISGAADAEASAPREEVRNRPDGHPNLTEASVP